MKKKLVSLSHLLKSTGLDTGVKSYFPDRKKDQNNFSLLFVELVNHWQSIVGKQLGQLSLPLSLKDKTLIVLCGHPAVSAQMASIQGKIKQKIDKRFPALKYQFTKLGFKTNESLFKKGSINYQNEQKGNKVLNKHKARSLHPESPQYKEKEILAKKLLEDIEDSELKAQLTSLLFQI